MLKKTESGKEESGKEESGREESGREESDRAKVDRDISTSSRACKQKISILKM